MTKLQFLCSNHRQWLLDNPTAAIRTWMESYSRGLDLADEREYAQAVSHAGTAFEISEIVLGQATPVTPTAIHRFTDSSVLLVQLLYVEDKSDMARAVLAASVARLEQLLLLGVEKKVVLAGCDRLLNVGESPTSRELAYVGDAHTTLVSTQLH